MWYSLGFSRTALRTTTGAVSLTKEFDLISLITSAAQGSLPEGWLGTGDDCAVLQLGANRGGGETLESLQSLIVSVDTQVEGVHFRKSYFSPADIGWRSLAVAVSDIAAMGGEPLGCLVSLQVTSDESDEYLREVYLGLGAAAEEFRCPLLGGDTVSSGTFALSVTVLGACSTEPFFRSAAQEADDVWVSGRLGAAAVGFQLFESATTLNVASLTEADRERVEQLHLRPRPQLQLASALRRLEIPVSAIDISDGVLADAAHLAEASSLGLELDWQAIPVDESVCDIAFDKAAALTHGDDYQLLFCVSKTHRSKIETLTKEGFELRRIGHASADMKGVNLVFEGRSYSLEEFLELQKCGRSGYQHS